MIVEAVRIVADWLADPTRGVNAQLASVPRDAGDPLPASVTVVDETRNQRAAVGRGGEAADGPVVAVYADTIDDLSSQQASPNGDVRVRVGARLICPGGETKEGRAAAYITLRAIYRSLTSLSLEASDAERVRNDVQLVACSELGLAPGIGDVDDVAVYGDVMGTWELRELGS